MVKSLQLLNQSELVYAIKPNETLNPIFIILSFYYLMDGEFLDIDIGQSCITRKDKNIFDPL